MSFGVKNTRAKYQSVTTKVFKSQIGRMLEVYMDDQIVKTKTDINHVPDLPKVYYLTGRVIEANTEKRKNSLGCKKIPPLLQVVKESYLIPMDRRI